MSVHFPAASLWRAFAACALLVVALPAAAQWTGKGEAGFAITSGNSDTRTANAKIAVSRKVDAWDHTGTLAGLYVRNDGQTSARRWEAGEQTHFGFGSGKTFWFGGGRYEKDRFSGFAHQGILNTGVGHKFTDTETTKFSVLVGAGYKFVEILGTPNQKDNSAVGTAGLEYSHRLTATTTLINKFGAEFAAENNFLQNELGLSVKVSTRLALAIGYAMRHNTAPPAGFKKTDRQSTVNLVYEVK